jgi:hypothetical protein
MTAVAWTGAGKRALARNAVQSTVASSLVTSYKNVKRKPEDFYNVRPATKFFIAHRAPSVPVSGKGGVCFDEGCARHGEVGRTITVPM